MTVVFRAGSEFAAIAGEGAGCFLTAALAPEPSRLAGDCCIQIGVAGPARVAFLPSPGSGEVVRLRPLIALAVILVIFALPQHVRQAVAQTNDARVKGVYGKLVLSGNGGDSQTAERAMTVAKDLDTGLLQEVRGRNAACGIAEASAEPVCD